MLIIFLPDGIVGSYLKRQARRAAAQRRGQLAAARTAQAAAPVATTRTGAENA